MPKTVTRSEKRIPDRERWLHEPDVKAILDRAIAWAEKNPPRATDLKKLFKRAQRSSRSVRD
jgi:hypothetical protein